jgi:hypothetical protein
MKRIIFLLIAAIFMAVGHAQNITDALRYATDAPNGTARFHAMSGAFGALGGDLSSVGINPAGSAVFLNTNIAVSLSAYDRENQANYFNRTESSFDTDVTLNQAGAVFVFNINREESPWKKFTIGVNYDNNRNYNDELFIKGNGNTSISEFFLQQAQGIPLDLLQLRNGETLSDLYIFLGETEGTAAQNALLGYQGYIFDPVDPNNPSNTQYLSNVSPGTFNQEYLYLSSGYNGKFTVNAAAQFTDNLYFGINLNSYTIDYSQSTYLFERNSNTGSFVDQIGFKNNLSVLGSGFSAQIGGIGKIGEHLRIGLTLDTPTWYEISEETTQSLETRRNDAGQSIIETVNPRVLNIYDNYNLRTPGKASASVAYIFGKSGLISFDYSYKDFSNTKFDTDNSDIFDTENIRIENALKGVSTYKLGGEYRINQLSLRGGLRYEESPYVNEETIGDLSGFSLGMGYTFRNYNFDIAYSRAEQSRNQQLYNIGLTDSASIDTTLNNVVFTLGLNF